jgi:very-short-patch-repair endonuclease
MDPVTIAWDDDSTPGARWRAEWAARAQRHRRAARHGFVLLRSNSTLTDAQIDARIRREELSAPRHGVIAVIHPRGDDRVSKVLAATAAALVRRGSVVSHESAAILYGLPVLSPLRMPTITAPGRNGSHAGLRLHRATLRPQETRQWYGTPLTSVARTIADLSRRGIAAGLVSADAAIRDRLISPDGLATSVESGQGWPGVRAARWVAEHADGLSESPLESMTRACLVLAGLPRPELQVWVAEARARVDMLYRDEGVVIEADGLMKYSSAAALYDEKRRQERLEQSGYRVVRVLWADVVERPVATADRVRAALRSKSR